MTEGGADFNDYLEWDDVPIDVNPWYGEDNFKQVSKELEHARIGDEISLDGCSVCYILNA